jgi:hypothetical protein
MADPPILPIPKPAPIAANPAPIAAILPVIVVFIYFGLTKKSFYLKMV